MTNSPNHNTKQQQINKWHSTSTNSGNTPTTNGQQLIKQLMTNSPNHNTKQQVIDKLLTNNVFLCKVDNTFTKHELPLIKQLMTSNMVDK